LSMDLKRRNGYSRAMKSKSLAMLFMKTSTRTRVSFEVGMAQMGGHAINLNWAETNFTKGSIEDESKVLGLYCDCVMARVFEHEIVERIAKGCDKPVINGLSDLHHPCQALADMMTVWEAKGRFKGLKIGWLGDGNNVCHSLMEASSLLGVDMTVATPRGYEPKIKGSARLTNKPDEAAKDADVLVTDTWVSLGQESEKDKRLKVFPPYQLNGHMLSLAKKDCIVMHCLPAQQGKEITSDVFYGPNSRIFQESENRLHTEKALLLKLI